MVAAANMIIYTGFDDSTKVLHPLEANFQLAEVDIDQVIENNEITAADVLLIGPAITNPVKLVQKTYASDKQLSIVVLVWPQNIVSVKQSIQFAPFIGSNTVVCPLNPEIDIATICKNAALRTKQRRSFNKIKIQSTSITPLPATEKVRLEQLGNFLEHAPIAAIVVNEEDRVIHLNSKAKSIFVDNNKNENKLHQMLSLAESEKIKKFIHQNKKEENCIYISVLNKHFEITASEITNDKGHKHFLILLNDITIQKQESERIQKILEALPQMAWTTNANGEATYFTKGWYNYTGQQVKDALGDGWSAVVHPEDREKLGNFWKQSVETGKPLQQAARYRNMQGEYRWHLVRSSAIKDESNSIMMWVGTCTDIHDQILLTEELDRKVKERTRTLEETNSELEQFAHVSSHDLQEPLRKIRTFTDIVKRNPDQDLNQRSIDYLDKISSTAARMSSFLNDLLNFTRLHEQEKYELVNLNEIVDHVLVDLELMINQKNAVIEKGELPQIKAIPIQMQLMFYNLINNALKFSKPDQQPRITVTSRLLNEQDVYQYPSLTNSQPYYEIVVRDNGIGFEQQYAQKIFSIFQRLHTKLQYAGTGIGLSLVKKVVNNHKGEIHAVSAPGEGAAFHIILPA